MTSTIRHDIIWWMFGDTKYRSGDVLEQQYVLELSDQALSIRRKTAETQPGMFEVIMGKKFKHAMVSRYAQKNSNSIICLEFKNSYIAAKRWSQLTLNDHKPPNRLYLVLNHNKSNFKSVWEKTVTLIGAWTSVQQNSLAVMKELVEGPTDRLLVYDGAGLSGGLTVYHPDMIRLGDKQWLNDSLIEFGLRWWYKNLMTSDPSLANRIYIFNTYFFKKIYRSEFRADYEKVANWTKKVDVFDKDFIIVPINSNDMHWFLAVICYPGRILKAPPYRFPPLPASWKVPAKSTPPTGQDESPCLIVVLDSFMVDRTVAIRNLREWLQEEAVSHHRLRVDTSGPGGYVKSINLTVPRQADSHNCGWYLLIFVEIFMKHSDQLLKSPERLSKNIWDSISLREKKKNLTKALQEEVKAWQEHKSDDNMEKFLSSDSRSP